MSRIQTGFCANLTRVLTVRSMYHLSWLRARRTRPSAALRPSRSRARAPGRSAPGRGRAAARPCPRAGGRGRSARPLRRSPRWSRPRSAPRPGARAAISAAKWSTSSFWRLSVREPWRRASIVSAWAAAGSAAAKSSAARIPAPSFACHSVWRAQALRTAACRAAKLGRNSALPRRLRASGDSPPPRRRPLPPLPLASNRLPLPCWSGISVLPPTMRRKLGASRRLQKPSNQNRIGPQCQDQSGRRLFVVRF